MSTTFALTDAYQFVGFLSILLTVLVGVIQRDRASQRQIYELKENMHREIAEIREEFVKKVDFEKHFSKIENNIERIHSRLDDILQRLMAKT